MPAKRRQCIIVSLGKGGSAGLPSGPLAKRLGTDRAFDQARERAAIFAQTIGAEYVPLQEAAWAIEKSWLVIYSLSMLADEVREADFSGKVLFEANYASPNLSPERNVKSRLYIRGEYWLYNQAVPAFELFTGCKPDCEAMKKMIGI